MLATLVWVCAANAATLPECDYQQSVEQAVAESDAIFLARAVEERPVPLATKGGAEIGYKEVRFEVKRSWKLVDRRSVWVRIVANAKPECGYNSVGLDYLVYANRLNDLLFVAPYSRTMHGERLRDDLEQLGPATISISEGEFYLSSISLTITLVILAGVVAVFFVLYRISKRPMRRL